MTPCKAFGRPAPGCTSFSPGEDRSQHLNAFLPWKLLRSSCFSSTGIRVFHLQSLSGAFLQQQMLNPCHPEKYSLRSLHFLLLQKNNGKSLLTEYAKKSVLSMLL